MIKSPAQDWVKFKDFLSKIDNLITEGTLRAIILKSTTNGASHFCKKIGKNLFLSPTRFYEWMEKQEKQ